jgi:PAS domain S-box-containing protein
MNDKDKTKDQLLSELTELRRRIAQFESNEMDSMQAEDKFRVIFSNSLDAIMVIDSKSGRILSVNQATSRILGYEDKALIGNHFSILFPPESKLSRQDLLGKIQTHDTVFTQKFLHAKGPVSQMDLTATLIPWKNDKAIIVTFRSITERLQAEEERQNLINQLQEALAKVKTLSGLLPICASCKKIRDDKGYWNQIEAYIRDHSEAEFTHSLCPECADKLRSELKQYQNNSDDGSTS